MLQLFRSILKSKVGALVGIAVLAAIALSFAAGDIKSLAGMGGGSADGTLAKVGGESVTTADLRREAGDTLQRMRQSVPNATMKMLVDRGGIPIILNDLIDLASLHVFGEEHGVRAGDRLIDSEIQRAGAAPGSIPRSSVAERLVARQLLAPAELGATLPREMAQRYAGLLAERRTGSILILPSLSFAPQNPPSNAELAAFYKAHTSNFIRPERRVLRFASFGEDAVKNVPAPTDAEIAQRYAANKAQYAALEQRTISQVVVPTEAAAKALAAEVQGGKSLEAAAAEKGLAASKLGPLGQNDLAAQTSPAAAQAAFTTPAGKLAAPAKGAIGWYVIRVEAIDQRPGRSLDQAKAEISAALAVEKRRAAVTDFLAKIEEQFENGANLPEVAKSLGLQIQTTPPITADGLVYAQPNTPVPPVLKPVLKTAFTMDEGQPQVAEAEPGKTFVIYDVSDIAVSAPAPFNQIVGDVKVVYALEKGSQAAKAEAIQIQAALRKGEKLDAIYARIGKKLPAIQKVGMTRPDLSRMQQAGRQVPPPIRLLFAMATGTAKVQEAPQQRGWFVVVLDGIEPGKVDANDPAIAAAQRELGKIAGTEYSDALRKAIRNSVSVKRNEAAIKAVGEEFSGGGAAE